MVMNMHVLLNKLEAINHFENTSFLKRQTKNMNFVNLSNDALFIKMPDALFNCDYRLGFMNLKNGDIYHLNKKSGQASYGKKSTEQAKAFISNYKLFGLEFALLKVQSIRLNTQSFI